MTERLTETFIKVLKPPARGSRLIWDDALQITFPGNEQLLVRIARAQLLQELNIGDGKS